MGKTVGNLFLILVLLSSTPFVLSTISLRIINEDDDQLQQVQLGRPFTIEVAITGNSQVDEAPTVQGVDQFSVESTSWRYEMINSETKVKYLYNVVAQKPGIFTVGPAILISKNSNQEVSNTLKLKVSDEEIKQSGQRSATLLRLSVDKNHVVRGEKVKGTLRFYFSGKEKLRNFIEQESKAFNRKKTVGPERGTETINGVEYDYLEFSWDMYPLEIGQVVLPAFGAEYEQHLQRDHMWGGLGRLFGAFTESKRIYSNAVTLQVDDIPESDKKVQGIGAFDSFTIKAEPPIVNQAEGMVIAIELKGSFDSEVVSFPGLVGVPKDLRYYESKESTRDDGRGCTTKRFEYILQGMATGSWEIPAQTFYYFDVKSRSFQSIQTTPISITIMPGPVKKDLPSSVSEQDSLLPCVKQFYLPMEHTMIIPWWLFIVICLIPIVWFLLKIVKSYLQNQRKRGHKERKSRLAINNATALLKKVERKNEPQRIYTIFIGLFADKWQMPLSLISDQFIVESLKQAGFDKLQLEQWNIFISQAAELAYGGKSTDKQVEQLFKQAEKWLQTLERVL